MGGQSGVTWASWGGKGVGRVKGGVEGGGAEVKGREEISEGGEHVYQDDSGCEQEITGVRVCV